MFRTGCGSCGVEISFQSRKVPAKDACHMVADAGTLRDSKVKVYQINKICDHDIFSFDV